MLTQTFSLPLCNRGVPTPEGKRAIDKGQPITGVGKIAPSSGQEAKKVLFVHLFSFFKRGKAKYKRKKMR